MSSLGLGEVETRGRVFPTVSLGVWEVKEEMCMRGSYPRGFDCVNAISSGIVWFIARHM